MAKVPTLLSGGDLQGTPLSPSAQPISTGLDSLAEGGFRVAGSLGHAASVSATIDARRQRSDEERWEGDALFEERKHLNEWMLDPENNSKESFAKDFMDYANGRLATYEEAAPSERSRKAFKQKFQLFVLSRHDDALAMSEKNRLSNSRESVISQTALALENYRAFQSLGFDSVPEADQSRKEILERVDKMFATTNPEVSRKLRGYVDAEFAIGMGADDKEYALDIVNSSKNIPEDDKSSIRFKIESAYRASEDANITTANQVREDHLAAVEAGNARGGLPLSAYAAYRNPRAEKASDDFKVGVFEDVNDGVQKLAPMAPDEVNRRLEDMRTGITTKRQALVHERLVKEMAQVAKAQMNDRVTWLATYNPEVKAMGERLKGVDPKSPQYQSMLNDRNTAILKYQGFPMQAEIDSGLGIMSAADVDRMLESGEAPKIAPAKNPEQYLGLASNDRELLSGQELRKNVDYINAGSPQDVMDRINGVLAQFPDPYHQSIAFNDMVQAKDGIRPEFQLLWQNKNQWFVQSAAQAITDAKSLGALADAKRAKLNEEIDKNKSWASFEQAVGQQRASEAATFKSAVAAYANSFMVGSGDTLKGAVEKSVNHLISSTLGTTKVNGRPMIVSRERDQGRPPRTDEEINEIGRNLGVALSDVPVQVADQSKLAPLLNKISTDEKNINRLQAFRDVVTKSGHWMTSNDGQSATLFVTGDDGIPFELHDKKGLAFRIAFDELPNFTREAGVNPFESGYLMDFLKPWQTGRIPLQPTKSVPLRRYDFPDHTPGQAIVNRLDALFGVYQRRTYWPTNTYMRMTEPGK